MYDRAERNITQLVGSTPLHVGPGSYDPAKSQKGNGINFKIKQ